MDTNDLPSRLDLEGIISHNTKLMNARGQFQMSQSLHSHVFLEHIVFRVNTGKECVVREVAG